MFLGIDLFSGIFAMTPNYVNTGDPVSVSIYEGNYNKLYVTSDPDEDPATAGDTWTHSTRINANYIDSLDGGNTEFSLRNTDEVVIKIRESGKLEWLPIYSIPINDVEDFNISKRYPYCANDTEYDIMVVSMLQGAPNAYVYDKVKSEFTGICLADKDHFYISDIKTEPMTVTYNFNSAVLPLLNNRYPVVVSNDDTNYTSGTITSMYLKVDENCDFIDGGDAYRYREEIMAFLTNKRAKVIKFSDGMRRMIQVVGTPTVADGDAPEIKNISFDWVEIGDVNSAEDLYNNILSDVNPKLY